MAMVQFSVDLSNANPGSNLKSRNDVFIAYSPLGSWA